jgi:transcriptional regulator with XRE-family HTH domain
VTTPGARLKALRESLGYKLRDVEVASERIAQRRTEEEYAIPISRLSDFETKSLVPSLHRLYSLAVIYRVTIKQLLVWYGIDTENYSADLALAEAPKTRPATLELQGDVRIPVKLDPSFDLKKTVNLGRLVEKWGIVPLSYLQPLANADFTYGFVGIEDYTMYPLIMPGTFLQIDESKNEVQEGSWRSEYERPIYFVETRDEHICCWCTVEKNDRIVLQPHPLSPVTPRIMRHPQEAEVIGQVVGMAMRLDGVARPPALSAQKAPAKLN